MVEGTNLNSGRLKHQPVPPGRQLWGSQVLGVKLLREDPLWQSESKAGSEPTPASLSTHVPWSLPQAGSLFEADFSLLDGVKPNIIIFKQQYVTAPLVMLKLQPDGKLLPMVIQVRRLS